VVADGLRRPSLQRQPKKTQENPRKPKKTEEKSLTPEGVSYRVALDTTPGGLEEEEKKKKRKGDGQSHPLLI
jgi:hypothetical protein